MTLGTLYTHIKEGDGPFTRTVLPEHLVKHYKIDSIKVSTGPDEYYPATFPAAKVPAFRFEDGTQLTESVPIALMSKYNRCINDEPQSKNSYPCLKGLRVEIITS